MGNKKHIETLHFGLIGAHLGYSFSKNYFDQNFLSHFDIPANYTNFELENIKALAIFCQTQARTLNGFNVTIPYKESIIPFLDNLSPEALAIGAVNTVKLENNLLVGYNTDFSGFSRAIEPFLQKHHKKALILGKGGAAKAVEFALQQKAIETAYVSRKDEADYSYQSLTKNVIETHQIIVNTTPLGMYLDIEKYPNIPYDYLTKKHLVFDLIYNPQETLFLQKAAAQHAQTSNGLKMLQNQAELSWYIWMKS